MRNPSFWPLAGALAAPLAPPALLAVLAPLSLAACDVAEGAPAAPGDPGDPGGDPAASGEAGVGERAQAATAYAAWVTTSTTDPYVNRCANDPEGSVRNLGTNPGYVMGYRSGSDACSAYAPTTGDGLVHRQGIQRLTLGGANYFLVTTSVGGGADPGFEVVRLGTRGATTAALGKNVEPKQLSACGDAVVGYASDGSSVRDHAGGLQASGAYAIVPFEHAGDDAVAGFRVASLADPANPQLGPFVARTRGQTTNAGAAALTRLSSGAFLALIFGNDSDDVEVFVSSLPELPGHGGSASQGLSRASAST
ncbi:MAG TPA: hypothetical protein VFS00_07525, partial [Polyangiaceae bacterium]|nr:hypothetical protein [Polyangiaceae bacterium]